MLLIRVRVRPCRERLMRSSSGRLTSRTPSLRSTVMGAATWCDKMPLGPLTVTSWSSMATSTPDGTSIGSLPIRDMSVSSSGLSSPDVGENFPTHALLVGLAVGQQTLARRDDRDAQAAEHARQAGGLGVHPQAGLADAADAGDRALTVAAVLEGDRQRAADGALGGLGHLERGGVALLLEDLGEAGLQLAVGHGHRVVVRLVGVAQTGQHVCDRVSHRHGASVFSLLWFPVPVDSRAGPSAFRWSRKARERLSRDPAGSGYQLDLVMPGSSPRWAISRRQIRHRPNLRWTALGRPQRWQ